MQGEIYGWAYACPFMERIGNCPMKKVEHLSFKHKVKWINNLSEIEIIDMSNYHKNCLQKREQLIK